MADENLPQPDQRLKRTGDIGTEQRVADLVHALGRVEELVYGFITQAARLAEDRILAAVIAVVPRQAVHGSRLQGGHAIPIQIADRHEDFQRLVLHGFPAKREERLQDVIRLLPGGGQAGEFAIVFPLWMVDEQVFPDFQIAGDMGLAVGIQPQPGGEQHHVRVGTEHRPGWTRGSNAAAHGGVEALHAHGIGQILLHGPVDAGQGVVQAGEPAIVLRHEFVEELGAFIGRGARQLGPGGGGTLATGDDGLAVADFEHTAKEVEDVRVGLEARVGIVLAKRLGGFPVEFREPQIQAADGGVGEEGFDKIDGLLGRTHPVLRPKDDRHLGGVVVVGEGAVGAQRLLQVIDREPRVGGEKGAGGVDRLQHDFRAAAAAHAEAKDADQLAHGGRLAVFDLDHLLIAGQLGEFMGLGKVAMDQLEVLGLLQRIVAVGSLVAIGDDVASQGRQNLFGSRIRRDRGHAGERTQRTGNRGGELWILRPGGGRGSTEVGVPAGAGMVRIEIARRGFAIARQQIQGSQTACDHSRAGGVTGSAQHGQEFDICLAAARIAVPVEELRICGERRDTVGGTGNGTREGGARTHGVARKLHFAD